MKKKITVKDIKILCSELYQICGALECNSAILDNLSAASRGLKPPHKTLLPFIDREDRSIELQDTNRKLKEALGIALQYVPMQSPNTSVQEEIDKIYQLIKEATDISTKGFFN